MWLGRQRYAMAFEINTLKGTVDKEKRKGLDGQNAVLQKSGDMDYILSLYLASSVAWDKSFYLLVHISLLTLLSLYLACRIFWYKNCLLIMCLYIAYHKEVPISAGASR